jgi:pleiotropic regulator 1
LEYNKVIRHYHGHLSGVYCLSVHPTLDILVTGGRDSVARVWDMRSKQQIHSLGGHTNTVCCLQTQGVNPQVLTGSMDSTVKLWDLAAGRSMTTMTNHKKAVRTMRCHPNEFTFCTGAADNIKKWKSKDGQFIKNLSGHNSIINAMDINQDGVMMTGGDNGSMHFWDYNTGYCFQKDRTTVQPGSLDSEAGIYAATFDHTGSRLITTEADKTIKIWKEDEDATPETHPIDMEAWKKQCLSQKRY